MRFTIALKCNSMIASVWLAFAFDANAGSGSVGAANFNKAKANPSVEFSLLKDYGKWITSSLHGNSPYNRSKPTIQQFYMTDEHGRDLLVTITKEPGSKVSVVTFEVMHDPNDPSLNLGIVDQLLVKLGIVNIAQ